MMRSKPAQRIRHRRQGAGIAVPLQIDEASLHVGAVIERLGRQLATLQGLDQLIAGHPRFSFIRWLSPALKVRP